LHPENKYTIIGASAQPYKNFILLQFVLVSENITKIVTFSMIPRHVELSQIMYLTSPTYFCTSSEPMTRIKQASVLFATALAHRVLPVPGGPNSKTPFGGSMPRFTNFSGCKVKSKPNNSSNWPLMVTFQPCSIFTGFHKNVLHHCQVYRSHFLKIHNQALRNIVCVGEGEKTIFNFSYNAKTC